MADNIDVMIKRMEYTPPNIILEDDSYYTHEKLIKKLVETRGKIIFTYQDAHGNTVLMNACRNRYIRTVIMLLENGAGNSIDIVNNKGQTASEIARLEGIIGVQFMLERYNRKENTFDYII